jgi:two-component system, OmpR family, sensor kinase
VSLRARLLATLLILAAVGLVVADVATYSALRRFMVDQVDDQLRAARASLGGLAPFRDPGSIGVYAEVRNQSGVTQGESGYHYPGTMPGSAAAPDPRLPAQLPGSGAPGYDVYFDAPASSGPLTYRVLATQVRLEGGANGTLIVAIPLSDVIKTLHRLVALMLIVGVVVLLAIAAVGTWRVRRGLKPLEQMGETAGAIAAGDLTRRVENTDERTEVGRLGIALNAMLAQIEAAFEQRRRSENRLRRFVADASHELRTPLTSIRGYAELFRRGAADRPEDLAKAMERIEAEASRMGILVEDLLLLARMDEGRPMEREPVDLAALVGEAVGDARAAAPDLDVTITESEAVVVPGDPVRLRQVVDNLLDNARTHTPPGTHVRVAVTSTDDDAVVTVEDDGPGLPPEQAAKVFERFYRADESRSRDKGGAGLGLSISSAIAEGHGGTLTVGPSSDGGARFELRLPTHPVDPDPEPDEPGMPPPPGS